jgi:hypothetical protein
LTNSINAWALPGNNGNQRQPHPCTGAGAYEPLTLISEMLDGDPAEIYPSIVMVGSNGKIGRKKRIARKHHVDAH